MNLDNICVGMEVKNYKELCGLLGVKATTGKSKIIQLNDFERYFKFEKRGYKFFILDIYTTPIEKPERKGNNSIFRDDFRDLMICMLHYNGSGRMLISKSSMYRAMNMVNDNYFEVKNQIPLLSETIEVPEDSIYEFYENNYEKFRSTVSRNLYYLRRKSLLMHQSVTVVAVKEVHGTVLVDGSYELEERINYRIATEEEKQLILKLERETMLGMGCGDLHQLFKNGKWRKFKNAVESKLFEMKSNIQFYYEAFNITWIPSNIEKEYDLLDNDISSVKSNLNRNMVKSIKRTARNKQAKALKFEGFGTAVTNRIKLRRDDNYISHQEQLTDTLVCKDAKKLSLKGKSHR